MFHKYFYVTNNQEEKRNCLFAINTGIEGTFSAKKKRCAKTAQLYQICDGRAVIFCLEESQHVGVAQLSGTVDTIFGYNFLYELSS